MALGQRYDYQSTPAEYRPTGRARIGLPTSPKVLLPRAMPALCAMTDRRVLARDREIIRGEAGNRLDPIDRVEIVLDQV